MPVTSLSVLRLSPGTSPSTNPSLLQTLLSAKNTLEAFSNSLAASLPSPSANPTHIPDTALHHTVSAQEPHKFHLYTQHEDASRLYILGSWPSASMHTNSFIPSAENTAMQSKLAEAGVEATEWTVHIELEQSQIPLSAPVLAISQHAISPANNAAFEDAFDENKHHLEHFSTRPIAGGWEVEKVEREDGGERDVFVLFSGWEDVDHHLSFEEKQPERYAEYQKIVEWIDEGGFEVKHAVQVGLEGKD